VEAAQGQVYAVQGQVYMDQLTRTRVVAVILVMAAVTSACSSATTSGSSAPSKTTGPISVTPLPTPSPTGAPQVEVITGEIRVGGQPRTYRLAVPSDVAAVETVPLVLVLHPYTGTPSEVERRTGFDKLAADDGVLVAYPSGYRKPNFPNSWNAGGCCEPATTDGSDDVGFLAALIDQLSAQYPVDPDRVYLVGGSNGGEMAYRATCELSERIAAVVNFVGTLVTDCNPTHAVSVLDIHGTDDDRIPYEGGTVCDQLPCPPGVGCEHVACPSVADTMERWRTADGCTGSPALTEDGNTVTTTFSSCRDGTEVTFIKVIGKGHDWYDSEPDDRAVAWEFLASHPRSTG
jgi:polyhydroxybutyrate depolymerase